MIRSPVLPPHSLETERALIGAAMLEPGLVLPPLLPAEFYGDRNRVLWQVMLELDAQRERPTLLSVAWALNRSGHMADVGGVAYLSACFEEATIPYYVPALARQIRADARQRALMQLGTELAAQGLSAADVETRLRELPGLVSSAVFDPADNWDRIVHEWATRPAIAIGLSGIDALTGGLRRATTIVVGGRTSHGKTTFTCDRALALAMAGTRVELVSLEDTQDEVVNKLVSNTTRIDLRRLRRGVLSPEEFAEAERAVLAIQGLPLTVTDLGTREEAAVASVVSASKAEVVMIDHVQKIDVRLQTRGDLYTYAVKRVMERLDHIARRDGKVVWVNAQLSRETDHRKGPPMLSDLRDSGNLEETARLVLLLYWPQKHDVRLGLNDYEVWVAKNSGGGTGKVELVFEPTCGRFSDQEYGR